MKNMAIPEIIIDNLADLFLNKNERFKGYLIIEGITSKNKEEIIQIKEISKNKTKQSLNFYAQPTKAGNTVEKTIISKEDKEKIITESEGLALIIKPMPYLQGKKMPDNLKAIDFQVIYKEKNQVRMLAPYLINDKGKIY